MDDLEQKLTNLRRKKETTEREIIREEERLITAKQRLDEQITRAKELGYDIENLSYDELEELKITIEDELKKLLEEVENDIVETEASLATTEAD